MLGTPQIVVPCECDIQIRTHVPTADVSHSRAAPLQVPGDRIDRVQARQRVVDGRQRYVRHESGPSLSCVRVLLPGY